jgi:NitT/TauT family transport system ATP-binding protein
MSAILSAKHIIKTYHESGRSLSVLADINLEISPGEFFVFVGPSGSGKSTLLRIMSGLDRDFGGSILYGERLRPSEMSFVFQQFALFPWLTVAQNIEFGLIARGVGDKKRREIVRAELATFGLEKFAHAYPRDLSGGMKQRVGIARALATEPRVIFMDEPFSELDSFTAAELRKDLLRIWHERKPTIIMVTHIIEEAIELADRIAVLTPRPGKIEKIFQNTLPRPRQERSQEFYRLEDTITEIIKP